MIQKFFFSIFAAAYRKSVANRRRKKRVRINDIECNNKGNLVRLSNFKYAVAIMIAIGSFQFCDYN